MARLLLRVCFEETLLHARGLDEKPWTFRSFAVNRTIGWVVLALVVGGGLGAFYYVWKHPEAPAETMERAAPERPQAYEPQEAIRHPIPEQGGEGGPQPLPSLDQSDTPLRNAFREMYGASSVAEHLAPERIIRRIVITVDNLSREKLAIQMRPIKPLSGAVVVDGDADNAESVTLSAANYARYRPLMQLLRNTDTEKLSALYFRLYPLFQQAYEELGYPGKYFNDRLVETIDHLLQTPEPTGEIRLVRPKVFFEFADPELESRSAGQKLLIRMGPENAALVKEKLRALRTQVAKELPVPAQ